MRVAITGASSGLGWYLALGLATQKNHLLLFGRDFSNLIELKGLVEKKGALCEVCVTDLLCKEGIEKTISALTTFCPELYIQCAGIGRYGYFCDVEKESSIDIMRLNVLAVMETTHAWANAMKKEGRRAKVVFISSTAAFLPMPGMAVYGASKACLLHFAEGLRYEEKGTIDVLTVCPGYFATNFQRRAACAPLVTSHTHEAKLVANKIIASLHRTGIYIPFPWNWILPLRRLIPERILMKFIKTRALSFLSRGSL